MINLGPVSRLLMSDWSRAGLYLTRLYISRESIKGKDRGIGSVPDIDRGLKAGCWAHRIVGPVPHRSHRPVDR